MPFPFLHFRSLKQYHTPSWMEEGGTCTQSSIAPIPVRMWHQFWTTHWSHSDYFLNREQWYCLQKRPGNNVPGIASQFAMHFYMTSIQGIFCVAVFLQGFTFRSGQNFVWNICLLTEFTNQIWRGKLFPGPWHKVYTVSGPWMDHILPLVCIWGWYFLAPYTHVLCMGSGSAIGFFFLQWD